MKTLEGRVVVVTGGAGIGRETSLVVARSGAAVVVVDSNTGRGNDTLDLIKPEGGAAISVTADVGDPPAVAHLSEVAVRRYGYVDGAVNNAGVSGPRQPLTLVDIADFDGVIRVNLRGVFLCMQAELRLMERQGRGAIVNVASTFGLVGHAGAAPYAASKHAVIGLTRTAALEHADQGIRVNAVCPGPVRNPMTEGLATAGSSIEDALSDIARAAPVQRHGRPAEIAEAIAWFSETASFVTGSAMAVDGGWTAR